MNQIWGFFFFTFPLLVVREWLWSWFKHIYRIPEHANCLPAFWNLKTSQHKKHTHMWCDIPSPLPSVLLWLCLKSGRHRAKTDSMLSQHTCPGAVQSTGIESWAAAVQNTCCLCKHSVQGPGLLLLSRSTSSLLTTLSQVIYRLELLHFVLTLKTVVCFQAQISCSLSGHLVK